MKKTIVVAMVFAAFMAGSGCIKDKEKDFAEDQVSFSANTGALETRTDYGEDGSVGETSVTYVNWVAGDKIKILSSTGYSDTYTITDVHDGSDSDGISKANVNPDNDGIAWGSGTQTFYGKYPAVYPAAADSTSLTSSTMTCYIPGTWTPSDETALSQLPYGYMLAKETTSRTTSVSLTFNPKFTAFTFTLKNPTGTSVALSSLTLTSASKAMSGTYKVSCSDESVGTLPTYSKGTTDHVRVAFPSGFSVPAGTTANPGTKTFTLVAVPDSFSDLTVTCTNSGGSSRTLGLKKSGAYLTFAALKKHNISITLPSFAEFEYSISVTNPTDLTYNGTSSTNGAVTSYKSNDVGMTETAVPWYVEGYYATEADAEAGTNKLDSYSTSGLLSAAIANVTSPTSVTTSVPISYNRAVAKTLGDYIDDNIKNSTFGAKSSSSRYINLANAWNLVSDTESDAIIQSANCYIVNGPGYYRIPLIMGNGQYTSDFVNYKGNSISTDAYLKHQGTPTKAKVIWEDVDGLINGASSDNDWEIPRAINGDWLRFYIDKNHIKQGNAVIAVYDNAETPAIMWSYHIWVTDYVPSNYAAVLGVSSGDISHTNSQSITYTIPRYDLGMVINGNVARTDFYVGSVLYARLQQGTVSSPVGQHAVMQIHRPEYIGTITDQDRKYGHCTYYQWGRNDPLQGNYTTVGKNSGIKGESATYDSDSDVIKYGINNPNSYNGNAGKYDLNTVWDLNYTPITGTTTNYRVKDKSISKTIYDPSPVGYHVPPYAGLSGITVINFGHRSGYTGTGMNTSSSPRWSSLRAWSEYAFSALETGNSSFFRSSGVPIRPVQDPTFDPTND